MADDLGLWTTLNPNHVPLDFSYPTASIAVTGSVLQDLWIVLLIVLLFSGRAAAIKLIFHPIPSIPNGGRRQHDAPSVAVKSTPPRITSTADDHSSSHPANAFSLDILDNFTEKLEDLSEKLDDQSRGMHEVTNEVVSLSRGFQRRENRRDAILEEYRKDIARNLNNTNSSQTMTSKYYKEMKGTIRQVDRDVNNLKLKVKRLGNKIDKVVEVSVATVAPRTSLVLPKPSLRTRIQVGPFNGSPVESENEVEVEEEQGEDEEEDEDEDSITYKDDEEGEKEDEEEDNTTYKDDEEGEKEDEGEDNTTYKDDEEGEKEDEDNGEKAPELPVPAPTLSTSAAEPEKAFEPLHTPPSHVGHDEKLPEVSVRTPSDVGSAEAFFPSSKESPESPLESSPTGETQTVTEPTVEPVDIPARSTPPPAPDAQAASPIEPSNDDFTITEATLQQDSAVEADEPQGMSNSMASMQTQELQNQAPVTQQGTNMLPEGTGVPMDINMTPRFEPQATTFTFRSSMALPSAIQLGEGTGAPIEVDANDQHRASMPETAVEAPRYPSGLIGDNMDIDDDEGSRAVSVPEDESNAHGGVVGSRRQSSATIHDVTMEEREFTPPSAEAIRSLFSLSSIGRVPPGLSSSPFSSVDIRGLPSGLSALADDVPPRPSPQSFEEFHQASLRAYYGVPQPSQGTHLTDATRSAQYMHNTTTTGTSISPQYIPPPALTTTSTNPKDVPQPPQRGTGISPPYNPRATVQTGVQGLNVPPPRSTWMSNRFDLNGPPKPPTKPGSGPAETSWEILQKARARGEI